jgi:hypothetical protein
LRSSVGSGIPPSSVSREKIEHFLLLPFATP